MLVCLCLRMCCYHCGVSVLVRRASEPLILFPLPGCCTLLFAPPLNKSLFSIWFPIINTPLLTNKYHTVMMNNNYNMMYSGQASDVHPGQPVQRDLSRLGRSHADKGGILPINEAPIFSLDELLYRPHSSSLSLSICLSVSPPSWRPLAPPSPIPPLALLQTCLDGILATTQSTFSSFHPASHAMIVTLYARPPLPR